MKRIFASVIVLLCLTGVTFAAIPAGTVWEVRTTGAQASGGGFAWTSLVSATYKWTVSASGTNEYYCEIAAGGDPSLVGSGSVTCDGNYNLSAAGSVGSLAAGQHAFGDNDTLGYTTLYVRLANGLDPDAMIARGRPGYVQYGAGGVDYSQQAAAQMSATDIAIVRGDTTQVYRTGATKWAQDYDNNILHITAGTGFTADWYRISSVDANDDAVLDRSAGTAGSSSGTGAVGGAFLLGGLLDAEFGACTVGGNRIYVASGTYTAGEGNFGNWNGTSSARSWPIGYTSTRGDATLGTDRPLINMGAYANYAPDYGNVFNLRWTGTNAQIVKPYGSELSLFVNCSATNTNAGAGTSAWYLGQSYLVGCEGQTAGSGSSYAFTVGKSTGGGAFHCYAHDSAIGFGSGGTTGGDFFGCIADTCTTGFSIQYAGTTVIQCTTYNCTTGIGTDGDKWCLALNNIVSNCTTGLNSPVAGIEFLPLFNDLYNTTDFSSVVDLMGSIFADPGLNAPATGDFSITSTDTNVYEQGVDVGYFTTAITYDE